MIKRAVQHLQAINIQDEYGTPQNLYDEACKKYNIFPHIDICSNQINAKCYEYITKEQDALKQEIDIDAFMNPPYSSVYDFMKFAYEMHLKYGNNWLILVYAKTDTRWWHAFVENKAEVHFIKGRVKFNDANGNKTSNSAPYPSCWIIYRGIRN